MLIIDESKGRKLAKEMGIPITGTLGILVTAKQQGYIKAEKPLIARIQKTNVRISERRFCTEGMPSKGMLSAKGIAVVQSSLKI